MNEFVVTDNENVCLVSENSRAYLNPMTPFLHPPFPIPLRIRINLLFSFYYVVPPCTDCVFPFVRRVPLPFLLVTFIQ